VIQDQPIDRVRGELEYRRRAPTAQNPTGIAQRDAGADAPKSHTVDRRRSLGNPGLA